MPAAGPEVGRELVRMLGERDIEFHAEQIVRGSIPRCERSGSNSTIRSLKQTRVVAENIAAEIVGNAATHRFNDQDVCYIETGDRPAAYGAGNFYGIPAPAVSLEPPSARFHDEKHAIERAAHALWLYSATRPRRDADGTHATFGEH